MRSVFVWNGQVADLAGGASGGVGANRVRSRFGLGPARGRRLAGGWGMPPLTQEDCADDDRGEGRDPDRTQPAMRERLAEDRHPGDDRKRAREQGGDAGGREGAAVLESRLEHERPEGVGGDQGRDEGEVSACLDGALRRDVAGCEQDPGARPYAGPGGMRRLSSCTEAIAATAEAATQRPTLR